MDKSPQNAHEKRFDGDNRIVNQFLSTGGRSGRFYAILSREKLNRKFIFCIVSITHFKFVNIDFVCFIHAFLWDILIIKTLSFASGGR